jgi:ribonucleoside-diphosphate reductase alpha chain
MASKFLSQDEKDAVGIINRQMTLSDAPVVGGVAAADTTSSAGSATASPAASPASSSSTEAAPTRSADQDSEASASRSGSAAQDVPEVVPQPVAEKSGSSLLDGLKIVAQNSAAATREARLNAGQAPVVFDTADSPACTECGSIMVRNGSCYKCINCGATSGCS